MAITLMDMAKGLKDKVVAGIVLQFARESQLFQRIPYETVDSFYLKTWQLESVSHANWRKIGSAFQENKDKFTELQEGMYLLGGQIDIDTALRLPGQKEIDVYKENVALQSKRFMYEYTDKFINGDRNTEPDAFDGIKKRVEAVGGDQVIVAGANGLDVGASSANRHTFLDMFQQAMFEVRDGKPDLIITSKRGLWNLQRVARREGLLNYVTDAFDRKIEAFDGVPVMWAGTKGDQSTEILTSTEVQGSSGAVTTSYYFVKFGAKLLTGVQMRPPERLFDDVTDDGVTHRVVFQWPVGLAYWDKKSIVRLKGVKPL